VGGNPPDEPTNVPGVSTGAGSGCFIKTVGGVPTAGGFMALALVLLLGLAVYIRRR
jgi:MYXO-CTERM domain-containing protein